MAMRERVGFANLPAGIRAGVTADEFIKAYELPQREGYVVWVVNRDTDFQRELEYSSALGRFLTLAEREARLPAPVFLPTQVRGFSIAKGYRINEETQCLYETYALYESEGQEAVAHCEQIVFVPSMRGVGDVVGETVDRMRFPQEYASWSEDEKMAYWARFLYRIRHQAGEMGSDPDIVFDAALSRHLKGIDANIDHVIDGVLVRLGEMESVSVERLRSAWDLARANG